MEKMLLAIFHFFEKRRLGFFICFLSSFLIFLFFASQIKLEEDISKILPRERKIDQMTKIFQNAKFADKLIFSLSLKDTTAIHPDSLVGSADFLMERLPSQLKPFISRIEYKVSDSPIAGLMNTVSENLPLFLNQKDYSRIDQIMNPDSVRQLLMQDIRTLSSPAGIALKQILSRDPLGISFPALKRLSQIQVDENYELHDNAILTRDQKHLLFFIAPVFPPNNTGKNSEMLRALDQWIDSSFNAENPNIVLDYFGANAVSAGNARQLRKDSIYTLGIILVFLILFIGWYFKRKRAPLLILIPALYGAVFSLACIHFIKPAISVIALGTGSLILGVAISYSIHVYNHYLHTKNKEELIRDLAFPLTIGSFTTIGGFFCLEFVQSEMLKDLGLFAGFSLIGAAFCSLVFMPHLLAPAPEASSEKYRGYSWIEKISQFHPEKKRWLILLIIALTIIFSFYAGKVSFESDMTNMNYMSPELKASEARLNKINENYLKSVYLVASGKNLDQALANMEKINPRIDSLKAGSLVKKSSGVSVLLFSNALQKERIRKWKGYWSSGKKQELLGLLKKEGSALHFKKDAFLSFASFIDRDFQPLDPETVEQLKKGALADYITEDNNGATVSTVLRVSPENKKTVYRAFESLPDITVLDKQYLAEKFVEIVNADFTKIALMTSILVFSVLLLTYGRIELTMVSFIPMAIAWIWILGIMGLAGIRFNIINIILSALIFGLGDDYSLFIMDGLLQEYKTGKKNLSSFKSSIILSAITTLAGLGVLIFARHPALRSIAIVSIIGMLCVVLIAQTLIPFLFGLLITNRVKNNRFPWTFLGYSLSIFSYFYFAMGALLLTVVGFFLIRLNPFQKEKGKVVYHRLLSAYAWSVMYVMGNVKKRVLNPLKEDFAKPCVIIANHSSFLDILLTAMLYPKLILLTNNWVWNSPVFGQVVKLADYYPVQQGIENSIDLLADRINHGYSVVVFPEGSRSPNDQIRRFHKGAFFLAEKLELDILPIMIHGSGYGITKGDFLLKDAWVCLKFLPRILPDDDRFGAGYANRAKYVARYFREEFEEFKISEEQPKFFKEQLIYNYIYKGPVLEWYLKVKLRLEKNYQAFHEMLPRNARILDLGCGYGFMDYMLQFAAPDRRITGIDYDEDKINLARHCFSRNDHIEFICADIAEYSFGHFDAIILSDTLHYLPKEKQQQLIAKCIEHLSEEGMIIIREGNQDLEKKHRGTRLTEFFSTRVLGFNKTGPEGLSFLSGSMLKEMAIEKKLGYRVVDHTIYTSNMIFVLSREQQLVQ